MARHRHSPSPARSTVCRQDQCRHSAAALPCVSHGRCTCSRSDFIPSWLQHVQTSYNDTSPEVLHKASPGPEETTWHPNGIPTVRIQSSCGAGRYQPSDLFIQDTPLPSPLPAQTNHHRHYHEFEPSSDHDKDVHNRKGYSHTRTHVSTPPEVSSVERDVFEKRPRRKTRKDRYNTAKSKDVRSRKQQAKRSSTRVSKNGKLRSSREIMANFKSGAIANPNERITLKPSFTPGLFVNGRSSMPFTDLVFNDIPSPDEGRKAAESEQSPERTARKPKGDFDCQNEIEILANALRRLEEGCPPLQPSNARNSRATSITSSYDFQSIQRSITADSIDDETAALRANTMPRHGDSDSDGANDRLGGNNGSSPHRDNYKLHIRSIYSLSATTDPHSSDLVILDNVLPSDSRSIQEAQKESAARHRGLEARENSDERNLDSGTPTKPANYEDKGIMELNHTPPSTFSRLLPCIRNQQDQPLQSKSAESVESQIYEQPIYLPHVSERPNLKTEIKDIHHPHSDSSPAWLYDRHSTHHPLYPYSNSGLPSVGDFELSKTANTQSRVVCNADIPAQLDLSDRVVQLSREAYQDSNIFCSDSLHLIDDLPGESLREYIERMEREILGPGEASTPCIDDALLSPQGACQSQIPGDRTVIFLLENWHGHQSVKNLAGLFVNISGFHIQERTSIVK
ncbi:hypothetical protein TrVGV298_005589 [Trichoderma virens]|nr:hypothetical protein TrVGV298_005589 [Trichoderma virens]